MQYVVDVNHTGPIYNPESNENYHENTRNA